MPQPIDSKRLLASLDKLVDGMVQDAIDDPSMHEYLDMVFTSPIIRESPPSLVPSILPPHAGRERILKDLINKTLKKTKAQ